MHEFLLLTITPVVWPVAPVPIRLSAAPTASSQDMEGLQRAMKKKPPAIKISHAYIVIAPDAATAAATRYENKSRRNGNILQC